MIFQIIYLHRTRSFVIETSDETSLVLKLTNLRLFSHPHLQYTVLAFYSSESSLSVTVIANILVLLSSVYPLSHSFNVIDWLCFWTLSFLGFVYVSIYSIAFFLFFLRSVVLVLLKGSYTLNFLFIVFFQNGSGPVLAEI